MRKNPTVLLIPGNAKRATHAPSCPWVAGTKGLDYRTVAVRDVPATQPRCRHCGGGR